MTAIAGAVGRVEGEDPRLQLGDRGAAAEAGELLREHQAFRSSARWNHCPAPSSASRPGAPGCRAGLVPPGSSSTSTRPSGKRRGGLHRFREAAAQVGLHHQAIDDDRDVVLVLLVEADLLVEAEQLAVDLDPRVPLEPQLLEQLPVLALAPADDRGHDHEPAALLERHQPIGDLLQRLAADLLAAVGAVRRARSVPRGGAGSRGSRSPCRPSSAGCARSSSGRSRSPARAPRSSRRRASPSGRGTGARRRRATRRSGAGPRRRSCRRRGSTCPSRRGP